MEENTKQIANAFMVAVCRTGVVNANNAERALPIIRAELIAFLSGDEYANERECIKAGTISWKTAWMSAIVGASNKIAKL